METDTNTMNKSMPEDYKLVKADVGISEDGENVSLTLTYNVLRPIKSIEVKVNIDDLIPENTDEKEVEWIEYKIEQELKRNMFNKHEGDNIIVELDENSIGSDRLYIYGFKSIKLEQPYNYVTIEADEIYEIQAEEEWFTDNYSDWHHYIKKYENKYSRYCHIPLHGDTLSEEELNEKLLELTKYNKQKLDKILWNSGRRLKIN